MQVIAYTDPESFAAHARPLLAARAAECTVISSNLAAAVTTGAHPDALWLVIENDGTPAGLVMRTPPYNAYVTTLTPGVDPIAAMQHVAEALHSSEHLIPGVTGSDVEAHALAEAWCDRAGGSWSLAVAELLLALSERSALTPESHPSGTVRVAGHTDVPGLVPLIVAFFDEIDHVLGDPEAMVRLRLQQGAFLLCELDGETVSYAGVTGPIDGVCRIGPVYSSPQHRGQGHAGAVTAAAAEWAYAHGAETVMLFADAANATATGLYRRLGFTDIGTATMLTLHP